MKVHNLSDTRSLLDNYIAQLRDVTVQRDSMRFRKNIERIAQFIAFEISKSLDYEVKEVSTPLAKAKVNVCADKIVVASILRAGLAMHNGVLDVFDGAENCFVSAYRKYTDNEHFDVHIEYLAAPDLTGRTVILCDPMFATGRSMQLAIEAILTHGRPAKIIIATIIASQFAVDFGVKNFDASLCELYTAVIDPDLNDHSYIVPGIGDAGDLAFGEKL